MANTGPARPVRVLQLQRNGCWDSKLFKLKTGRRVCVSGGRGEGVASQPASWLGLRRIGTIQVLPEDSKIFEVLVKYPSDDSYTLAP